MLFHHRPGDAKPTAGLAYMDAPRVASAGEDRTACEASWRVRSSIGFRDFLASAEALPASLSLSGGGSCASVRAHATVPTDNSAATNTVTSDSHEPGEADTGKFVAERMSTRLTSVPRARRFGMKADPRMDVSVASMRY